LAAVRSLNRQFAERLKSVFLQTIQQPGSDGSSTQKSSAELAEKIAGLWVNAKLFEKGYKLFDGKSQAELVVFSVLLINSLSALFSRLVAPGIHC